MEITFGQPYNIREKSTVIIEHTDSDEDLEAGRAVMALGL